MYMKKRILVILLITFVAFNIVACDAIKRTNVYAFFNKAYGWDENALYSNDNQQKLCCPMDNVNDTFNNNKPMADLYTTSNNSVKTEQDTNVLNDNNDVNKETETSLYDKNAATSNLQSIKAPYKHFGIIVSGPSGVGKTTIINALKQRHVNTLDISVSATTRMKRGGEIHAKDYYFLDIAMFKKLLAGGEFLEYANNYGNYYGTPKRNYFDAIDNGKDIVFALSVDGMKNAVQHSGMDFVTIFIAPPSYDVLKQRLVDRNTETQAQINKRLSSAKKEISSADGLYNYVVYNYNLENTVDMIDAIYLAEQRKREIAVE